MKAEIFNAKSDDDFIELALDKYLEFGQPHTVVHFEIDKDRAAVVEFEGHGGMQLIGIALILMTLSNRSRLDPVELGIKVGLMARQIDRSEALGKKMDDKLTIKFNGEGE